MAAPVAADSPDFASLRAAVRETIREAFGIDDPGVAVVQRLAFRPGDTLVLHLDHKVDEEELAKMTGNLLAVLGNDAQVLIVGPHVTGIEVIGPDPGGSP